MAKASTSDRGEGRGKKSKGGSARSGRKRPPRRKEQRAEESARAERGTAGGAKRSKDDSGRTDGARPSDALSPERRLELYRWMLTTRVLEERLTNLYRQNQVVGGLYRSLGQEAETVAAVFALEERDLVGPLIRNMGAVLMKGFRPRDIAMQYMARAGGPTGGKDLNIHFGDVERGVISPISMLGDMIPVMAGTALAARMKGEDRVALTWIGDGGTSTGPFYEGLNLAALWELPLIVIAENNGYAYSTPLRRQTAVESLTEKALAVGMRALTIDGNDALAVYDAVHEARARAAAGEGPTLIEVMTYRRKGHAEHDMQKYVPEGEVEAWERKDPILRYERALVDAGTATRERLKEIQAEVRAHVDEEIDAALASPMPEPEVALESVYAEPPRAVDHLAPYREESR